MNIDIFDQARHLKELRDEKKVLEESVKALNADINALEYELIQLMGLNETQNFTHAGTLYYRHITTRASPAAERKEELFTNLREQGYGDMIQETVNSNTLSAFVKEQIVRDDDDNIILPDWLKGLVNVAERAGIGMRKAQ